MQSESWGAAPPDIQADDLTELCRLCRRSPHFATIRSWGTSTSSTPRKEKRSFTEYFGFSYGKANRAGRRVAAGDPSRRQPIGGYMAGCRRKCSELSTNAIARASTNLIVTNSPSHKEYFGSLWKEANPASHPEGNQGGLR